MAQHEIEFYLADAAKQKEIQYNEANDIEEYDSDLNRSLYQEFWTDLKEFKPKVKKVKKRTQSVAPGRNQKSFSGRTAASVDVSGMETPGTPNIGLSTPSTMSRKTDKLPNIFEKENAFKTEIRDPFAK